MRSLIMSHGVFFITALLHLFLLHQPVSYAGRWHLLSSPPFKEEKIRLGSTPPSCHNRCNACNPCKAVQVPTMPVPNGKVSRLGVEDGRTPDQPAYSQYNSNYKPLEWKCSCGARIFNP
ncbi:EPIDERMAL PATTERNING FACTOR-like protein 1 [Phalaenopsis equestris]|uniref:EPIDERMAL PATTERNING FACTOR-like protein 1 n=1 Tax=Phalaenopsis equestris TaxID=78828 RepID=UPI0009E3645F|nr:EPIDERMAL PATTERNING FACTOR-like protein 1 [Phalaenopsis equestris]